MEYVSVILSQMSSLSLYVLVGYILHATKLVGKDGCRALGNLLLYVILPCVIVNSFLREATEETTRALLVALAAGALLLAISIAVSHILFRCRPVDDFSSSFCNAGFMGIPTIVAALGSGAVFYVAGMVALLSILQWTYGQRLLGGERAPLPAALAKNPLLLSFLAGLALYFLPIRLPSQIDASIKAMAGCNAPVAMVILGYYLREVPLRSIFCLPAAYAVSAARLVLIPLLSMLALNWLPGMPREIKVALLIAASTPVGSNVAIYAERLDHDYGRAVVMICLSSALCLVTMPAVIWLFSRMS